MLIGYFATFESVDASEKSTELVFEKAGHEATNGNSSFTIGNAQEPDDQCRQALPVRVLE